MISHLADKELLYKSYLNDVMVSSLFIVKCKGNYRRWLFATYKNYDSNLPLHDLLTSVSNHHFVNSKAKQNVEYKN